VQTWEAIRSRRDVRSFEDRPIADDHLDEILESGRRSPSSQNWQPWDFILVRQREQLLQLAHVWRGAGHVAHAAAAIALIAPLPNDERQRNRVQYDLGQATMSIMLAAAGLGIGSGHSSVSDQELARQLLGFPEDRTCAFLIPLGYPAGRPLVPIRVPDRRPFDEVVHRGRCQRPAEGRGGRGGSGRAGQGGKQYESLDASPPCSRTWCGRRPRNTSPSRKNRWSNAIPPLSATSSFAIQAPTPPG